LQSILEVIITYLGIAAFLTGVWVLICDYYYITISYFGFKKPQQDYELIEDKTRFLILVAAHNEEDVLESSYHNWREIDYSPDLFRLVVVNDNSTDKTKEICEAIGAEHIDTIEQKFPREGVGKPGGIQYALRELGFNHIVENYDLLMVLDADNHVDSNILKEVNAQWQKYKPTAIQTYLDSKNPNSSMIARGYAMAYWMSNRFFQLAKYRLGLFNSIGGTGFAVSTEWLIGTGGFKYKSLTEDLEMEIEIVKSNGKILWNHHTRIYDEKPDNLKTSLRQRIRWSQGHWFVAFNNLKPLLVCIWKDKRNAVKYIDQLVYLFGMGRAVMVSIILTQITLILFNNYILQADPISIGALFFALRLVGDIFIPATIIAIALSVYSYLIIIFFSLRSDGDKGSYLKTLIAILYMSFTYMYTHVVGLLKWKQQGVWVKTPHQHTKKETQESTANHQKTYYSSPH